MSARLFSSPRHCSSLAAHSRCAVLRARPVVGDAPGCPVSTSEEKPMAAPNSKKVVIPNTMAEAGIAVFKSRPEIELAVFDNFVTPEDYQKFLKAQGAVHKI